MAKKDKLIVFKCSEELEKRIKEKATEKDVPISQLIRKLVERYLNKE